ncbi:MAG: hypothetical protein HC845_10045 [Akkermansiaceae bacterium]|nr:hypothetical protein [Akkermansiaceae bacterium]NJR31425.1 hypothetical protein [bacterium]
MPLTIPRRLAICGLVRDCKQAVTRNWELLRKLESDEIQVSWVFVENDSVDGSREWLDDLARRHSNVTVLGEDLGEVTIPAQASGQLMPAFSIRRMSKMAFFRNLYLDHVREKIGLKNLDAVMVVDFDVHSLPVDYIRECVRSLETRTVITAFGTVYQRMWKIHFYDSYAYREKGALTRQTYPEIDSQRVSLWRKFRSLTHRYEVGSNFNGCAIYPAGTLEGTRYVILLNEDPQVECYVEHVGLHQQMAERGIRIVLDPRLRVYFETVWSYWGAWLKRRLNRNQTR